MKQRLIELLHIPLGCHKTAAKWLVIFRVAMLCAITFSITAHADTPMELVIETPTRMPQALDKTIADTTVLDEQTIGTSGAADVLTLLRTAAGIDVVQSGGLGNLSSIFIRGTKTDHVLILLDGVRINSATTGATALEHIMLGSIERIEVVRGNVSSLYGSEAIGGVIQIFTKQGHGAPAFNASAGMGSHGTQRLAAGFSGSADATSFSVNIGKVKTSGVSAINTSIRPTANPDNDGYDNMTFDAQVKHAINADHLLSASMFSTRGNSQYDGLYNAAITDLNNTKAVIDKCSLSSDDQLNAMWRSKLNWAHGTDDSKDYLNGVEDYRFKSVNKQFVWQNELKLADTRRVNLAAEHLVQSVSSDTLFTQTKRRVNSLLGGYVGEYGTQQVQLNLRQDHYSDFGTANTGLLGYGLSFADNWRATASISNAFKAPTFNDLFYPFQDYSLYCTGCSYSGNPNLHPERSRNNEIRLHYVSFGQHVDAVYFDNRIHDLIASNGLPASMMININQARINGTELSYAGEFGDTNIKANVTLQNPRNTATGMVLMRQSKQLANLAVTQHFGAWEASGEWQYNGERQDNDINTFAPVTLPSYHVFNLNARYQIEKSLSVSARIDNVFNRDYMLVHGYNTLGRTLFVGLNYQQ